jgi:hypothetical protein
MNGRYHAQSHMRFNMDAILDLAEYEARQKAARVREVAAQLQKLMTTAAYDAWWNQAPDDGFLVAAEKKLAEELVAWEQQERYAEMIAKRRVEFVAEIRERNSSPCEFGSAAWFAGVPEEEI